MVPPDDLPSLFFPPTSLFFRPPLQASASDLSHMALALARFDKLARLNLKWQQEWQQLGPADGGLPFSIITEDWAEAFWDAVQPLVVRATANKAQAPVVVEPGQSGNSSSIVPSQLSVLMHSMGQLGYPPSEALMPSLLSYLESIAGSMTPVQDCQVGVRRHTLVRGH